MPQRKLSNKSMQHRTLVEDLISSYDELQLKNRSLANSERSKYTNHMYLTRIPSLQNSERNKCVNYAYFFVQYFDRGAQSRVQECTQFDDWLLITVTKKTLPKPALRRFPKSRKTGINTIASVVAPLTSHSFTATTHCYLTSSWMFNNFSRG